ncbi:putative monooxygenase [Moniliophthora roreri]|nr:putative monooxygenase [Moniliophthora roreri]
MDVCCIFQKKEAIRHRSQLAIFKLLLADSFMDVVQQHLPIRGCLNDIDILASDHEPVVVLVLSRDFPI